MRFYLILKSSHIFKSSILLFAIMCSFSATANTIKCSELFDNQDLPELRDKNRNFTTNRNLEAYLGFFKADKFDFPIYRKTVADGQFNLLENLMSMGPDDVYLNVGSGEGLAEHDLIKKADFRGQIIGVDMAEFSPQMQQLAVQNNRRLKFEGGKTLEQLEASGQLSKLLPQGAALITDLYASDTYSHHLDESMRIKLQHLRPGGRLATLIPTESYGFNFTSVRVGTRIRPVSKIALQHTQLSKRAQDYLQMNGFETGNILMELAKLKPDAFPLVYKEQLGTVCCDGESPDVKSEALLNRNSKVDYVKSQIAGPLGWIEAIRGVEIIALSEIPNSGGEVGMLLVLQRTTGPLYIPPLNLEVYEFESGPPTRLYSW